MAEALDDNFKVSSFPKYRHPFNEGVSGEIDTIVVVDDFASAYTICYILC